MSGTIADFVLMLLGISVSVIWIVGLLQWDGKGCNPDEEDCDHCPFPCEHRKK